MKHVNFKPFVGKNYSNSNPKILILGESHYKEADFFKEGKINYTIQVVKYLGQRKDNKRHAYFTKIAKVVTGTTNKYLNDTEALKFWDNVVFYNYVQDFMECPRIRPSHNNFLTSELAFKEVLNEYRPDIVIATGKLLESYVSQFQKLNPQIIFCFWAHPSAPKYFKYHESIELYEIALQSFKNNQNGQ